MPLTKIVKILLITNITIWVGLVLVVQGIFMDQNLISHWFGLVPGAVLTNFWIWQPFTYMFLHSSDIFHVVFNMLILWSFGSDLEQRWGSRFFLAYYLVSGVGAALVWLVGSIIYAFSSGDTGILGVPVVGASGAVFGLILAYGLLFGERVIYFMMIFPMRAKYFALIAGGIELVTLLSAGMGSRVANLAHLGGILCGFLFLMFWTRWRHRKVRKTTQRHGRKLKLVVDNERNGSKKDGPRYWN